MGFRWTEVSKFGASNLGTLYSIKKNKVQTASLFWLTGMILNDTELSLKRAEMKINIYLTYDNISSEDRKSATAHLHCYDVKRKRVYRLPFIWKTHLKFEMKKLDAGDLWCQSSKVSQHCSASVITRADVQRKHNLSLAQLFISAGIAPDQRDGERCPIHIYKHNTAAQWAGLSSTGPHGVTRGCGDSHQ